MVCGVLKSASRRHWLVPAAGALVLASSLAPWWVLHLADGGELRPGTGPGAVTAWQTGGWWPVAVAGALAVAVVWTGWRLFRGAVPGQVRGLLVLLSLAPVTLCVQQWRSIPSRPAPAAPAGRPTGLSVSATIQPGDSFTAAGLDPDRLYVDGSRLCGQGPGWGLYAGLGCLALLTVALLLSPTGESPTGDSPTGEGPTGEQEPSG
jgi:hypothetical protein